MKTELQLIQLGKEASDAFLRNGVPLQDSLVKLASSNKLNENEIKRVAETANVETYVKLLEKSADKDIEFALADSSKAGSGLTKKANQKYVTSDKDYVDLDVPTNMQQEFSFNMYTKNGKSVIQNMEDPFEKKAYLVEDDKVRSEKEVLGYLENQYEEQKIDIIQNYKNIFNDIKQSVLSKEASFEEIKSFVKTASKFSNDLWVELESELKTIFPATEFEKIAEYPVNQYINSSSGLFKKIEKFDSSVDLFNKTASIHNYFLEKIAASASTAKKGAGFFKKLLGWGAGATLVAGAPILFLAGRAIGKKSATGGLSAESAAIANQQAMMLRR